jgi:putative hydrolase of the HAD superfamily
MIKMIAFDADDTLWTNEEHYLNVQKRFADLLEIDLSFKEIDQALLETEIRNVPIYGYGVKSFALSMVETAIQLTGGQVSAATINNILAEIKAMLTDDVELYPHVESVIRSLAQDYRLAIITKGDLLHQQSKIDRSGLTPYVDQVEIVSEKTTESYRRFLDNLGVVPQHFIMVGNSLRSDVLPVAAIGGVGVHIPSAFTWAHEEPTQQQGSHSAYHQLEHIGQLPGLIASLKAA